MEREKLKKIPSAVAAPTIEQVCQPWCVRIMERSTDRMTSHSVRMLDEFGCVRADNTDNFSSLPQPLTAAQQAPALDVIRWLSAFVRRLEPNMFGELIEWQTLGLAELSQQLLIDHVMKDAVGVAND